MDHLRSVHKSSRRADVGVRGVGKLRPRKRRLPPWCETYRALLEKRRYACLDGAHQTPSAVTQVSYEANRTNERPGLRVASTTPWLTSERDFRRERTERPRVEAGKFVPGLVQAGATLNALRGHLEGSPGSVKIEKSPQATRGSEGNRSATTASPVNFTLRGGNGNPPVRTPELRPRRE